MGGARTGRVAGVSRRELTVSFGFESPVATGNPGAVSDSASAAGGLGTTRMGLVTLTELSAMRLLLAACVRESLAGLDRAWLLLAVEETSGEGLASEPEGGVVPVDAAGLASGATPPSGSEAKPSPEV